MKIADDPYTAIERRSLREYRPLRAMLELTYRCNFRCKMCYLVEFRSPGELNTDEYCEVNDSIRWISERLGVSPELTYAGGERGWRGDSPFIFLDCTRIRALGWQPKLTIREGIVRTLDWLQKNRWILEERR